MRNFLSESDINSNTTILRKGEFHVKIRTKIYVYFGILFLFLIAGVTYQLYKSNIQSESLLEVKSESLRSLNYASETKAILFQIQTQQVLAMTGLVSPKEIEDAINKLTGDIHKNLDQFLVLNPSAKSQIETIKVQLDKALHNNDGNMQVITDITNSINDFAKTENEEVVATVDEIMKSNAQSNLLLGIVQGLGLLFCVCAALILVRSIHGPIRKLTVAANRIAEGDLSDPLVSRTKDEIGTLTSIFEKMRTSLASFIEAAQGASNQVAASSQQLTDHTRQSTEQITVSASASQSIAEGADLQKQKISETARAMEEISEGVMRISDSTLTVSQLSVATEQQAKQGNDLLTSAVVQMDTIHQAVSGFADTVDKLYQHSKNIDQITSVIKAITAQTNLLSLNAGIEAARAGEHGKGFAVVAKEISKLAAQSKASSDQISEIIELIQGATQEAVNALGQGVKQVETGRESIRSASEAFGEITDSTSEISLQIQEISAASQQLSASAEQVTASINTLEHIATEAFRNSQSTAEATAAQKDAVREMAQSAVVLNEASRELGQYIAKYKIS